MPGVLGNGYAIYLRVLEGKLNHVYVKEDDLGTYWWDDQGSPIIQDERAFEKMETKMERRR